MSEALPSIRILGAGLTPTGKRERALKKDLAAYAREREAEAIRDALDSAALGAAVTASQTEEALSYRYGMVLAGGDEFLEALARDSVAGQHQIDRMRQLRRFGPSGSGQS